jgi:hypothetical protein
MKGLFKRFEGKAKIFLPVMQAIQLVQYFLQQLHVLKLKEIFPGIELTNKYAGFIHKILSLTEQAEGLAPGCCLASWAKPEF